MPFEWPSWAVSAIPGKPASGRSASSWWGHGPIHFLSAFRDALAQLKPGEPLDESTTLAPLASEAALKLLLDQVRQAVSHGARLVAGGDRIHRQGAFMQPTILTDITPDNPAFRQEFFGPVALFFPAKDEAEAIALANNSPFGLGGSFTLPTSSTANRSPSA